MKTTPLLRIFFVGPKSVFPLFSTPIVPRIKTIYGTVQTKFFENEGDLNVGILLNF